MNNDNFNLKIENNRLLTAPILVKGIPRVGWFLDMVITAIVLNLLGLWGAVPTFFIVYVFLFLFSKRDPDFLNINIIKNIKIKGSKNKEKSFKGNKYVN
ncbi:VirB3 family type IV secretion system protein [Arcobacter sp. F2176]|jgi:type IV secretory pathway TrbD component|uniref:VirB3 family type IV secretion system protein n=1 Tax=Arcobacter sp. F2176 TaxID=2044511 RepID=UPI00100B88E5|nr:VirB3 family type IV secretion system protein [Arcobacter sp. F2176]RXJ82178.1 hypothetical protein CRU95_04635 [Arcobacter sp. F2176]